MIEVEVADFRTWREAARRLVSAGVAPEDLLWTEAGSGLFGGTAVLESSGPPPRVPAGFVELAETVAMHRRPNRWALLYRLLWRLQTNRDLLRIETDDDVRAAVLMQKAVGRDIHQMHAFVRFRSVQGREGEEFIAWYRPDHYIVRAAAPFFARRFGGMRWAILTPDESAFWDMQELRFGAGVPESQAPSEDRLEELWRTYYASTFNPARVNPDAMTLHMPRRRWDRMPETLAIPELIHRAGARVEEMARTQPSSAAPWVPPKPTLPRLIEASKGCRGCHLFEHATQTVFGEGPRDARIMMVGEQPGDQEDLSGHPFIGPAGKLLDKALADAEVDRSLVYVTNAVKHFKFEPRGKRRIHQKPTGVEINACFPWLEAELAVVKPEVVVCLGATAAQALLGRAFRVTKDRGQFFPHARAKWVMATVHPSALLRAPDPSRREEEFSQFVADLRLIHTKVAA